MPQAVHRDERYGGWTNRETWATALNIDDDEGWREGVLEALWDYLRNPDATAELVVGAGDIIRENVEDMLAGGAHLDLDDSPSDGECWVVLTPRQWSAVRDIGSLWRVNWNELGAYFLDQVQS